MSYQKLNPRHRSDLLQAAEAALELSLPESLKRQRWFAAKSDDIQSVKSGPTIVLAQDNSELVYAVMLANVRLHDAGSQLYCLALAIGPSGFARSDSVLASFQTQSAPGMQRQNLDVCDSAATTGFWRALTQTLFAPDSQDEEQNRALRLVRTSATPDWNPDTIQFLDIAPQEIEQSNSSAIVGDLFVKLIRRPLQGTNPEAEVGLFLTDQSPFPNVPSVAGIVELQTDESRRICLAVISDRVPAESDAWQFTLREVADFQIRIGQQQDSFPPPAVPEFPESVNAEIPESVGRLLGSFAEHLEGLGRRTAELHLALASRNDLPDFCPEPLTPAKLQTQIESVRVERDSTLELLDSASVSMQPGFLDSAESATNTILNKALSLRSTGISQIRCHGDYHLGQILWTDDDFVIIDFEGEPDRPLEDRRRKCPAFKDVAGLVRSLHYAARTGAPDDDPPPVRASDDWLERWFACAALTFLQSYFSRADGAEFLPRDLDDARKLLDLFLLEKVLYEIRYELNHRPGWLPIPLAGLARIAGLPL